MRRKAPLTLMELMVMILVFALASALCLQAFVKSDRMSRRSEARDRAAVLCQNTAETLRYFGGDMGEAQTRTAEELEYHYAQGLLWQEFDENWAPADSGVYRLEADGVPTEAPGLRKARVRVWTDYEKGREPQILFEIQVAWQEEVSLHG